MIGALIQRADAADVAVVLTARSPGETHTILIGATPSVRGVGLLGTDVRRALWGGQRLPPGSTVDAHTAKLLTGAKIVAVGEYGIVVDKSGQRIALHATRGKIRVSRDDTDIAPASPLATQGEALARALAEHGKEIHTRTALGVLARARSKIERRHTAVLADIEKMNTVMALAANASWLLPAAIKAPRGARSIEVTDWSSGEPVPLTMPLDPAKNAREQVEAVFRKAKRSKEGVRVATERLAKIAAQLQTLTELSAEINQAENAEVVESALTRAKKLAPKDIKLPSDTPRLSPKAAEAARSYRTFLTLSGAKVLVGKGAAHNDVLTFRTAKPHDLWLHAKDQRGAHVVLPLKKGGQAKEPDFVDAAHLAAHFSDARDEAIVDVQYTYRKYLRKAGKDAVGLALVDREKVIALRIDKARLQQLLESEET